MWRIRDFLCSMSPRSGAVLEGALGHYTIAGIVAGTYPRVFARGPGYDVSARIVSVSSSGITTANFQIRRDWAGLSGGGEVVAFDGPDFSSFGCGPNQVIDQSLGGRVEQRSGLHRRRRHPEVRRGETAE